MREYISLGSPSGFRGRSVVACGRRNCEGPAVGVEGFGSAKTLRTSDARGPTMLSAGQCRCRRGL